MGSFDIVDNARAVDSGDGESVTIADILVWKKNIGDWGPSRRTAGKVTFAHRKNYISSKTLSIDMVYSLNHG